MFQTKIQWPFTLDFPHIRPQSICWEIVRIDKIDDELRIIQTTLHIRQNEQNRHNWYTQHKKIKKNKHTLIHSFASLTGGK